MASIRARLLVFSILILVFTMSQYVCFEEPHHNTSRNMFEQALSKWSYVDKTLLIKDTIESGKILHMQIPRKCGRTTILHMLRTFIEIPRDVSGNAINDTFINTTSNYQLFVKHNLKICKYPEIWNEHFGSYSVIYIDFVNMRNVTNYEELLAELRRVIQNSFLDHESFLTFHDFWRYRDDRYIYKACLNRKMTERFILKAYDYLARWLWMRYRKKVFLLVDNFEEYAESVIFKTQPNIDIYLYRNETIPDEKYLPFRKNPESVKMVQFMAELNRRLLLTNMYISKAFLTGTFIVPDVGLFKPLTNIEGYLYLQNHKFSEYYGMTEEEVMLLIPKMVTGRTNRAIAKYRIDDLIRPETIIGTNKSLYDLTPTQILMQGYSKAEFAFPTPAFEEWKSTVNENNPPFMPEL